MSGRQHPHADAKTARAVERGGHPPGHVVAAVRAHTRQGRKGCQVRVRPISAWAVYTLKLIGVDPPRSLTYLEVFIWSTSDTLTSPSSIFRPFIKTERPGHLVRAQLRQPVSGPGSLAVGD